MQRKTKKSETLMQIDYPHWLFKLICKIDKGKTQKELDELLMNISEGKIRKKDSKSLQMYRYWLTTLNLLNDLNENKKYTLTHNGKKFAKEYPNNKNAYQKILRSILLRNTRVGSFFQSYIKTIKERCNENNPITRNEIKKNYRGETERALFSLSYAAGLIIRRKNNTLGIRPKKEIRVSLKKFKSAVKNAYNFEIQAKIGLHLRKHYVEIYKIRDIVSNKFGWEDNSHFDHLFEQLLDSKEGRGIQIHGAAPQWYTEKGLEREEIAFKYEEKIYVFMSFISK